MEEDLDKLLDDLSLIEYRVDSLDLDTHTIGDLIELRKDLFRLHDRYDQLDKRSDIVRRRLKRLGNRCVAAGHELYVHVGVEEANDDL